MKEIYVTNTEEVSPKGENPEIHLFGRTEGGEPDKIIVEGQDPYLYVTEEDAEEFDAIDHDGIDHYEEGDFDGLDLTGDRPEMVSLTKVVVNNPHQKKSVAKRFDRTWEADVDYADRLRIKKDIKTGVRAPSGRCHVDDLEAIEMDAPPRSITFDIETDDRGAGFPDYGEVRVLSIVAHDDYTDETRAFIDLDGIGIQERFPDVDFAQAEHPSDLGLDGIDKLDFQKGEREMLIAFYTWVKDKDADLICGWNSNGFDTPFVIERGRKLGASPGRMARGGGAGLNWRGDAYINGRTPFDLMDAWEDTKFHNVQTSLDAAAEYELDDAKIEHEDMGFYELYEENTRKFLNYNAKDVRLTRKISESANALAFKKALRDTIGLDFENTSHNKDFISMMVRRKLDEIGLIGPTADPPEDAEEFDGAYVFDAFKGLKENVVGIDLASLYPNTLWMLNASPETKLGKIGRDFKRSWVERIRAEGYEVSVAANDVVFCLEEDGFMRELVDEALSLKEYAGEMKEDQSLTEEERASWKEEYNVRKTIVNSVYGVLGYKKFFLYDDDIAGAVTLTGQKVIKETARYVNEETIASVAYGDTDSNYIEFPDEMSQVECLEAAEQICDTLNKTIYEGIAEDLGAPTDPCRFEIEIEMYASRFFQSGQKKFYAYIKVWDEGMDYDAQIKDGKGKISISGYPCIKSNTAPLTKQVQKDTLEAIVRGESESEIRKIIHEGAKRIDPVNPDFDLIGIPGGIRKELTEYAWTDGTPQDAGPRAAHFGNLFTPKAEFGKGDTVKRVYLKHTPMEHDEFEYGVDVIGFERGAQLEALRDNLTVDVAKTQDKVIRSPMEKILNAAGVDVDAAIEGQQQSGLSAFC